VGDRRAPGDRVNVARIAPERFFESPAERGRRHCSAVVYIFGAWRAALALREMNPHWLMIALLVSWAGDTAALYIGRAFGRHKLAPRVSPSKTWEGAIGSVAGGVLAAAVYAHFLIPSASPWAVFAVAAAGNIAGQVGDLCESAFKRGAGREGIAGRRCRPRRLARTASIPACSASPWCMLCSGL